MVNPSNITPNHSHSNTVQNNSRKTSPQTVTKQRKPRLLWPILLVLAGAGVGLEFFGVTNVIRFFGEGGRPLVSMGIWQLTDVPENFWAKPFIDGLVEKRVISGYPNDSFRPEAAITRAEFAAMLKAALGRGFSQQPTEFKDVSPDFWAASAIEYSTEAGFFEGFPSQTFRPNQPLSNANAFVALTDGLLKLEVGQPTQQSTAQVLSIYEDANQIPAYAREAVAKATTARLVVKDSSTALLRPNQPMTRAQAAASIYQALVYIGEAKAIASPYVFSQS